MALPGVAGLLDVLARKAAAEALRQSGRSVRFRLNSRKPEHGRSAKAIQCIGYSIEGNFVYGFSTCETWSV